MRRGPLLLAFLVMAAAPAARAVIVAGPDGSVNTLAPGNGAPWDHVGTVGGASGVYLGAFGGGYWVLSATHVTAGNFTLGGTTYTFASGSALQIGSSDLSLFRITSDPGLASLTLSSTAPAGGSSVTMIGSGRNRATELTTWYVDTDPATWVWQTSTFPEADGTVGGYSWGAGATKRWGENTIEGGSVTYELGSTVTQALRTDFDPLSGETQGATGDSGGGVFYHNGSEWELAGILGAIGTFSGQPAETAVFGNFTYLADISHYRGVILTAIPEPSDVGLWAAGLAGLVALRRRLIPRGKP